jgi:hypothetical protein
MAKNLFMLTLRITVVVAFLAMVGMPALMPRLQVQAQGPPEGFPPERRIKPDDVRPHPKGLRPQSVGVGVQGTSSGLTDCMEGDVLVRAVFVDSDGSMDPNTYSWNNPSDPNNPYGTQEIDSISQRITSEYDFNWSIWAPRYAKQVKYWVEKNFVPVPYEPVLHPSTFNGWITAALSTLLGQSVCNGCEFGAAEQYALNGLTSNQFNRTFNRATVMFFVANGGQDFSDSGRSFAYIGGPYGVVLRTASFPTQQTAVHETGHLFWAFDEYSAWCSDPNNHTTCTDAPQKRACQADQVNPDLNGNCEACNLNSVPCVMKYISPTICGFTAHQVSWNATPLSPSVITNVKCPGCTTGGKLLVKGTGLDPTCTVYIARVENLFGADARVEYPADYRVDTQDLAVRGLFLATGFNYEVRVKRYADGLTSDPYIKPF